MTEVQVAIGLGRKAGVHPAFKFACLQVVQNDLPDEVGRTRGGVWRRRDGDLWAGTVNIHKNLMAKAVSHYFRGL